MPTLVGSVHQFNTGRRYAADGQRIVWAIVQTFAGRLVAFSDKARQIDGAIPLFVGNLDLVTDDWVLRAYDDFHYTHLPYEVRELLNEK